MTGLRLRDGFSYTRSQRGVYALTHRGPVTLNGRSMFALLDKLVPYLDGRYTEEDLTVSLSPEKAAMVRAMLGVLRDRGALTTRPEPDAGEYTAEIHLIDGSRPAPERVFEEYRDRTVGVLGIGLVEELVRAARRSGSRTVEIGDGAADIVYHVRKPGGSAAVTRTGTHYTPILVTEGVAWIGAVSDRRLAAWGASGPAADLTGQSGALLAGRVVHQTFRAVTGIEDTSGQAIRLDLDTWQGRPVPLLPHPYDTSCTADTGERFAARIATLDAGAEVTGETFDRTVMRCVDDRAGLFGPPTEQGAQLPLSVTGMRVASPGGSVHVTGTGLSNVDARRAAAMTAFATYGSLMLDPRRLVRPDGSPSHLPDDPDETLAAARDPGLAVWGHDLASGVPVTVAAAMAFPAAPPDGASAGFTWREAVERGLAARCRRLLLGEIAAPAQPLSLWDDDHEDRLLVRLAAAGEQCRLEDVTGWSGVPTFQCLVGDRVAGCAGAMSVGEARAAALHAALRTCQGITAPPGGRLRRTDEGVEDTTVAAVATRLAAHGWRAVAVPLDHDPEATRVMPYLVHVVLRRG